MVFGTLDQALSAARGLHRRHAAIHGRLPITVGPFRAGSPYQANDLAALRWVYATLIETALMTHDFVLPPLTAEERARYYAESHQFAALFGIPRAALPADWREFATYAEMMQESDVLTVSPAAREIAGQIFSGAGIFLRPPQWYRAVTASMLPPRLREAFGLSDTDSSQSERARAWLRRIYPTLPARLRHVGPYQEADGAAVGTGVAGPRYAGAQPALDRTTQAGWMSSSPRPNPSAPSSLEKPTRNFARRLHPGGTAGAAPERFFSRVD